MRALILKFRSRQGGVEENVNSLSCWLPDITTLCQNGFEKPNICIIYGFPIFFCFDHSVDMKCYSCFVTSLLDKDQPLSFNPPRWIILTLYFKC